MRIREKSRADLGWSTLAEQLSARARTPKGAALAAALEPLDDLETARARSDEITEARALRDAGEPLPLDGVRDLSMALERSARSGALDPKSLRDVASTLAAGARVRHHLVRGSRLAPRLLGRAALIDDLADVSGAIDDAFESSDSDRLSDRASPALRGLRVRALHAREELEQRLGGLLDAGHVAPYLQDRFFTQRDDRYVVPIRVDARARVRGIVHGTSQSGQTLFVEPAELVDLNNRLKLAELEVAEEERRILAELSLLVEQVLPRIRVNLEVLAALDLSDAAARLALDLRATAPLLSESGPLDLRRARHPLMVLAAHAVIANDLLLGFGHTLVVSGPNTGGKTVALKLAGLLSLMARAGLHLPVQEGSQVPFFSDVLSDVGDDQSLERDLSTFSAHILHLREFLEAARPGVLVLLDEVAVGTDPAEGAALAQAMLEELAARGATVVVTTHYDRLKGLAARDPRFCNASVGYDFTRLEPTYQLELGTPGASGAVRVARRLGLGDAVCDRASALAGDQQAGLESLLIELESERHRMQEVRAALEQEQTAAAAARALAEKRAEEAQERLREARRGAHDAAVETLQRARQELDLTRSVLRRSGGQVTPAAVQAARRQIDAVATEVHAAAPKPEAPAGRPAALDELKPGQEIWVRRLGGRGTIVSISKGGKIVVQAGVLKVTVGLDEALIPEATAPARSARSRRGHNAFDLQADAPAALVRSSYNTLDVRGERAAVALGLAEKFLDDALRSGQEAVFVIHGHGTGALRDALRSELARFPGVRELRPGSPEEGGDGVTVVSFG